jgi:hypothetical protein
MQMKPNFRATLPILLAACGYIGTGSIAEAQNWYFINGHPAPYGVARKMADSGAPYGYYWLHANGTWGAAGSAMVIGNIREGQSQPSLDEADDVEEPQN